MSQVCVVVSRETKLIHDLTPVRREMSALPADAPRRPGFVVPAESFCLADEVQDGLPAVQIAAQQTPNHRHVVSVLRSAHDVVDALMEPSRVLNGCVHLSDGRHVSQVNLSGYYYYADRHIPRDPAAVAA